MTDPALVEHLFAPATALPVFSIREGRIVRCSEAARERFHADTNQPFAALFDDRSRSKLTAALRAAPSSCEVQMYIGETLTAVRLSIVPMPRHEHLAFVAYIGAGYTEQLAQRILAANDHLANLTRELARQSADLDAARRRFESLAQLREQFISMLAHDVRGGLASVLLSTEALSSVISGDPDSIARRAVARIGRSARHVVELVDKVLEIARTESGQLALDICPVSLRAIVDDVVELYEPIAERRGVRIELVDRCGDDVIPGDRVRLGQVVGNIVENALRHSQRGGTVTVELADGPGVARVVVRDDGEGIPPELRERIFERFVQGGRTRGSLGLGLYIAREVVAQHHGRIFVDGEVSRGASFVIELPRAR